MAEGPMPAIVRCCNRIQLF